MRRCWPATRRRPAPPTRAVEAVVGADGVAGERHALQRTRTAALRLTGSGHPNALPADGHDVAFVPGSPFFAAQADARTLRMSFTTHPSAQIAEGLGRLKAAAIELGGA